MSIIVSSPKRGLVSIAQVQQMAPGIYPDDKVTKSSTTELKWRANRHPASRMFTARSRLEPGVCIAEITYENGNTATKNIVGFLKATK